jgi:hypothetical protein
MLSVLAAVSIGEGITTIWLDDVSFFAALDVLHFERGIAVSCWVLHSRLTLLHGAYSTQHTYTHHTISRLLHRTSSCVIEGRGSTDLFLCPTPKN